MRTPGGSVADSIGVSGQTKRLGGVPPLRYPLTRANGHSPRDQDIFPPKPWKSRAGACSCLCAGARCQAFDGATRAAPSHPLLKRTHPRSAENFATNHSPTLALQNAKSRLFGGLTLKVGSGEDPPVCISRV